MSDISNKPNILMIITDHHAYYAHNRPGEFEVEYPCFNAFCSEGVFFNRAYSVCPICTPARSSMMTGVYPSKHGLRWNTGNPNHLNLKDFRQGQQLYSHHISKAGYRNAYVGKWHCGREKLPVDYGIEGWSMPDYGNVYMSDEYCKYAKERGFGIARAYIEHSVNHPEWEGEIHTLQHPTPWEYMNCSGILQGHAGAHEENFVAHLAVEKLRELACSDQPWSLVASFWGPHHPYFPSEHFASMIDPFSIPEYPSFRDDLSGRPLRHRLHRDLKNIEKRRWSQDWTIWQEILARCYAQNLQTDAAIGDILDALDELGLSENTIVMWTSDHGDSVACHGGLWDKASTYTEEVGRVPLAIRWPIKFTGGLRVDRLVSNMDLTATILDAAGAAIPEDMDSRSLIALCENPKEADWPDYLICEHNGHQGDVNMPQRIIICGKYKYVAVLFDEDEMYDLEKDPYELNNLINSSEHMEIRDELRNRIIKHIEQKKDNAASTLLYALKNG